MTSAHSAGSEITSPKARSPRDPAVRFQPQPQVGPAPPVGDRQQVVRIRFQHGEFHQRRPGHAGCGGFRRAIEDARVDAAAGRMITREEAGVDVDRAQPAGDARGAR